MTIETKYNIGDKVWFARFNKDIYLFEVIGVRITIFGSEVHIEYELVEEDGISCRFPEYLLFPTKEELLKSL